MNDNDVTAEILAAFEELPPDERRELDEMGEQIGDGLKARCRAVKFGPVSGRELVGKLAMFLAKEGRGK